MSTRKDKKLNRAEDGKMVDHRLYVKTYRHHITRVLRDIEAGEVAEEDMEKFRNFIQMSLSLMETAPVHQIQAAWRHAEILSFEHPDIEDTAVVRGNTPMKESKGIVYPNRKL